jgi:hypothetical protein
MMGMSRGMQLLAGILIVLISFVGTTLILNWFSSDGQQSLGDQVKVEGQRRFVSTADGRRIELINHASDADWLVGVVDEVTLNPVTLHGWAIDRGAKGPAQVIAIVNDRIWASGGRSYKRHDIAVAFGNSYEDSGFIIPVAAGSAADVKQMRAYAVQQDGIARELNYAASIGNSGAK